MAAVLRLVLSHQYILCDFMIPALLDALTIFFIVAGLALLWLNLRAWRRRTIPIGSKVKGHNVHHHHATVPIAPPGREEHLAPMPDADLATSRARAEECVDLAARATSETDKEAWLQMAEKWIKLVEDAERGRSVK
jgi:hypothetical protein